MRILEVDSPRLRKRFIDFPHDLYADDPNYVPELYLAVKELLDGKKNPFFEHSSARLFLADEDGRVLGRIAAIRNNNYNAFAGVNVGWFGFFDVIEDYVVAQALLERAEQWLRAEKLDAVLGPANFTTNDTAGLLVEGFDRPPVVMMTYNKPYYADFLERYGFRKKMDMLAYHVDEKTVNRKAVRLAHRLEERLQGRGIYVRPVNMRRFEQEVAAIERVYDEAWDKNWGFVPPTHAEFQHLAQGLKMVIDPDFALVAEKDGEVIGFIVAIPDINVILRTIRRGRLFPTGLFKLLWGKRKIRRMRIILLGVLEKYRRMGIEGVFYARVISNGLKKGYNEAEASWVLENNEMMIKGVEGVNMKPYKRYRIYEKSL